MRRMTYRQRPFMHQFETLQLLYLLLPAYLASMALPFVKYWPGSNRQTNERSLGALVFLLPCTRLSGQQVLLVFTISFAGHIAVNHLPYRLGIRDTKW